MRASRPCSRRRCPSDDIAKNSGKSKVFALCRSESESQEQVVVIALSDLFLDSAFTAKRDGFGRSVPLICPLWSKWGTRTYLPTPELSITQHLSPPHSSVMAAYPVMHQLPTSVVGVPSIAGSAPTIVPTGTSVVPMQMPIAAATTTTPAIVQVQSPRRQKHRRRPPNITVAMTPEMASQLAHSKHSRTWTPNTPYYTGHQFSARNLPTPYYPGSTYSPRGGGSSSRAQSPSSFGHHHNYPYSTSANEYYDPRSPSGYPYDFEREGMLREPSGGKCCVIS